MKWKLDDQVKKVTINFEKGSCLRAFVKEKLNLSYEQFVLAQKLYVMALLGSFAAVSIYINHHNILKFMEHYHSVNKTLHRMYKFLMR